MNETAKTLTYVGVALVMAVGAYFSRPDLSPPPANARLGAPLFPDFDTPEKASDLQILRFDEKTSQVVDFHVAKSGGQWVIASHKNYPADARSQLESAATALRGLTALNIASELPADHEMFGVVEPDKEKTKPTDKGVGTKVTIKDDKGALLASLIVGKAVEGKENQRFVRLAGDPTVFTVEINTESLTTDFEKWIEKNLLQLGQDQLTQVQIRDYTSTPVADEEGNPTLSLNDRLNMTLSWDQQAFKWNLDELKEARGSRQLEPTSLLETEELNTQRLDEFKRALDDLQIVDVERKPAELGANLVAGGDFLKNVAALQSLATKGFYPIRTRGPDGKVAIEIYSTNGEVFLRTKDAVEYVLRFGNLAGLDEGDAAKPRRYLFISARVNQAALAPPMLEPLPPAEAGPAAPAPAPPAPPAPGTSAPPTTPTRFQEEPAAPAAPPADPAAAPPAAAPPAATPPAATPPAAPADPAAEKALRDAERTRIEAANKAKLEEHEKKVKAAEKRVRELNYRFADWYYVISDDVYKKIHLTRPDVVKEKSSAKEEGFDVDAFRELEAGPEKKPSSPPPGGPGGPGFGGPGFEM